MDDQTKINSYNFGNYIIVSIWILYIRKSSNSQPKFIPRKDIIEEVMRLAKQELPKSVGDNGDSIIKITAINENTLECFYKMNSKIADFDSVTLK